MNRNWTLFGALLACLALSCSSTAGSTPTASDPTTTTGNRCGPQPGCTDPEKEAGSYVSIGVMPSPYPINWASPWDLFVTILGTSAASSGLDRSHSIGHVLLKVRCGTDEPTYISQTGANEEGKLRQFWNVYKKGPNYLFVTQTDGKLYTDAEAKKDWEDSIAAQMALEGGTYQTDPAESGLGPWYEVDALRQLPGMRTALRAMRDLPPATRHRFLRATIRITEKQCRAILAWKKDYVDTGGSGRYAVHRAPWVMDADGKYDGGGCGSVSYAGAFYAAGLDYKRAAGRVVERLAIGTSRLTAPLVREKNIPAGWYHLQNVSRYVPGNVPCAKNTSNQNVCYGSDISWHDSHWKGWNNGLRWNNEPKDTEFVFSNAWGTNAPVRARAVPLVIFEPERFYKEILARWNNPNHDAFSYPGWCKIDGKVPTIVLDARNLTGAGENKDGRPKGLLGGFTNQDVKLP